MCCTVYLFFFMPEQLLLSFLHGMLDCLTYIHSSMFKNHNSGVSLLHRFLCIFMKKVYWHPSFFQLGGLAIFIRQTNVVWMLFVACIGAINYKPARNGKDHIQSDNPMMSIGNIDRLAYRKKAEVTPSLRHRKMSTAVNTNNLSSTEMTAHSSSHDAGLVHYFTALLITTIDSRASYKQTSPNFLLCVGLFHLQTLYCWKPLILNIQGIYILFYMGASQVSSKVSWSYGKLILEEKLQHFIKLGYVHPSNLTCPSWSCARTKS